MEGEKEIQDQISLEDVLTKRRLEREDELKQINSLGKVDTLTVKLDRKLGRNLALKLSSGPLGRKKHSMARVHSIMKTRKGGRREGRMSRNFSLDRPTSDYLIGRNVFPMARNRQCQQEEELKEIEAMNIVRNKSNHANVKNLIQNHVKCMCNHRVTIKSTSIDGKQDKDKRRASSQRKSILVTSMGEDEERLRQLYRQQSRVLIENMIQFPSHQQRVLQKLSLEQQKMISVVEVNKVSRRKVCRELHGKAHLLNMHLSSPAPCMAAVNQSTSETRPLLEETSPLSKVTDLQRSGACQDHFDGVMGKANEDSCPSVEEKVQTEAVSGMEVYMKMKEFGHDVFAIDTGIVMPNNCSSVSDDENVEWDASLPAVVRGRSALCDTTMTAVAPLAVSSSLPPNCLTMADEEASASDEYKSTDEDDSLSLVDGYAESSRTCPHKPHLRVMCSSPQFPLSFASHAPFLVSTFSSNTAKPVSTHGTYGAIEVEVNPFAHEFQLGPKSEDGEMKEPCFSFVNKPLFQPLSPQASISSQFSDTLLSPTPPTVKNGKKSIPSKALQDPDFLLFVAQLEHSPDVSDYITYKMGVIGDSIEKRYSKELNQAMDDIFFEVVKKNLSWTTFSCISRKLLLAGARIQDGILLIPCFSRRLMDLVPHLGSTIAEFTENMLDSYAYDSILGMGGWSSLMESYEEYSGEEEEVGSAVDLDSLPHEDLFSPAPSPPPSPHVTHHYNTVTNRRRNFKFQPHSLDLPDIPAEPIGSISPQQCTQTPQNFMLRLCNSVEVLFSEDEEVLDVECDIPNGFKIIGYDSNLRGNEHVGHCSNLDSVNHSGNGGTPFSKQMFTEERSTSAQVFTEERSTSAQVFTEERSASAHPENGKRRKWSSANIIAPLVTLTAHLVLLGCYLLKK